MSALTEKEGNNFSVVLEWIPDHSEEMAVHTLSGSCLFDKYNTVTYLSLGNLLIVLCIFCYVSQDYIKTCL